MKTYGELFAGIGGASQGLKLAGYKGEYAIEWNQGAIDILKANHDINTIIHGDVNCINFEGLPEVDLLWASPVCCSFSGANHHRGETADDMMSAYAIIAASKRAHSVIIENVPAYKESSAYRAIRENLEMQGLVFRQEFILNASDFANPSRRTRFYSVMSREYVPSIAFNGDSTTLINKPKIVEKESRNWFTSLIDVVGKWERSNLTKNQVKSILEYNSFRMSYPHDPFAIDRCGWYESPKLIPSESIFPCIKSHPGHDGKNPKHGYGKIGSYRRQYDFVHEGQSYTISPQLLGVLNGFPIDYNWGDNRAQAAAGIGNAVVPRMAQIMAKMLND